MMDYRKFSRGFFLFFFFLNCLFASCEKPGPQEQVFTGEALGTTYQVKFFSFEELRIENSLDSIFEEINSSMSTYQPDSDISRINVGDTSIHVDENFAEVFRYSEKIYMESEGYFDPTVGNLVNAYGFGSDSGLDSLTASEIDSMLQYVGFDKLTLTNDNRILKEEQEIYLEFNAIAKGFAVDVIGRFLSSKGIEDYLVEVGGELVARGRNLSRGEHWVVAIDDPLQTAADRTLKAALYLKNRALATSGNYRKFREDPITGERYVHTINPFTGLAEKSNLLSASVLAENCTLADGYATTFMVLGFERSLEILKKLQNVDVYFIYTAEDDEQVKVFASEGFKAVLLND